MRCEGWNLLPVGTETTTGKAELFQNMDVVVAQHEEDGEPIDWFFDDGGD